MAKDGGPAFPSDAPTGLAAEQAAAFGRPLENHPGMSMRDYFAAAALQGLIASCAKEIIQKLDDKDAETHYELMASVAIAYADAMLAERDK